MPTVGTGKKKKEFGYGSKAKKAASAYAERTGLKLTRKKNPGYMVSHTVYSALGKLLAEVSKEAQEEYEERHRGPGDPPLPGMSKKELEHYGEGRPSRKKVKKSEPTKVKKPTPTKLKPWEKKVLEKSPASIAKSKKRFAARRLGLGEESIEEAIKYPPRKFPTRKSEVSHKAWWRGELAKKKKKEEAGSESKKPALEVAHRVYKNMALALFGEGKQKQADIASDIELTKAGASSSSDPKSKRYSPSLHTMHTSPEGKAARREKVEASKAERKKGPAMQGVEAFEKGMEGVGPGMEKKAAKAIKTSKEVQAKAQKRLEVSHTVYRNLALALLGEEEKAKGKRGIELERIHKSEGFPRGKSIETKPSSHPSSTQSRMERELGSEAYKKLSSRPGDPSPVEAATKKRGVGK